MSSSSSSASASYKPPTPPDPLKPEKKLSDEEKAVSEQLDKKPQRARNEAVLSDYREKRKVPRDRNALMTQEMADRSARATKE